MTGVVLVGDGRGVCAHVQGHTCVWCAYESQKTSSGVILRICPPYFLRKGLSVEPAAADSARLAHQEDPGIFLALPPLC